MQVNSLLTTGSSMAFASNSNLSLLFYSMSDLDLMNLLYPKCIDIFGQMFEEQAEIQGAWEEYVAI